MEVVRRVKVGSIVIPSAHVWTRSGHAFTLTEGFEQCIIVEVKKQVVVVIELSAKRAIQELHLGILEEGQGWRDSDRRCGIAPCGRGALYQRRSGSGGCEL